MPQYGFFVDLSRCIGCNTCTIACKQWHDLEPGPAKPMRVYQWESGAFPGLNLHMLPVMCYHCEQPVCVDACENKALSKEGKYGAVLVDADKCRGNRDCWQACPYGSPQYGSDDPGAKMLKCDMCIERLEQGLKPICVLSCSMRALEFGPLEQIVRKYGDLRRLEAEPGHAPCRLACPAGVHAEEYMRHIAAGDFSRALESFRETSAFAGVLGRVCTHPCEQDCQRGFIERPLSIKALKRFMADAAAEEAGTQPGDGQPASPPANRPPCRAPGAPEVAVVGSGPAGLSCAYDLARMGYAVTVQEAEAEAGGLLRYGIPAYRLPRAVLDGEIAYIRSLGVTLETGKRVRSLESLFGAGYRAVFLATGAWLPRYLPVQGESGADRSAAGLLTGVEFLRDVNSGKEFHLGRRVLVIGGGSVAVDAARSAWRLGAEEVHILCLEKRDLACPERMPAQEAEILEAEEEGIRIRPSLGIRRILSAGGRVTGVETVDCLAVFDADGNFAPRYARGSLSILEADTVIVAVGQNPDPAIFPEIGKNGCGGIESDPLTLATARDGVFAGGDAVSGAADVISAVAAGRRAAVSIDRYLRGEELAGGRALPAAAQAAAPAGRSGRSGERPPRLCAGQRRNFREVALALPAGEAAEQAKRCFQCGATMPSVVFRAPAVREAVIPWDAGKALALWRKRQPWQGEALPDIFAAAEEVLAAPTGIVGRGKLVLKAKNSAELLYYTTDNE
jgi:DMSO reductase iron-sulfur subunit